MTVSPVEILLVEDNPGDVELTTEAFQEGNIYHHLNILNSGIAALDFLHRQGQYVNAPRPDLILLDLNLPGKSGLQVIAEIKGDEKLQSIPIVVFTTSDAERDILMSYKLHANCYIVKPPNAHQFFNVIRILSEFWFALVKLPPTE